MRTRFNLTSLIGQARLVAVMGVAYFVACHVALSIDVTSGAASIWPASGLLLGVLLLSSNRSLPSILAGALAGSMAANLAVGFSEGTSLGYTVINLCEGLAGRWLVRRYFPEAWRLRQPSDVFGVLGSGAVAAAAGALAAGALTQVTSHAAWLQVIVTWWGSDAAGVAIVAPVVLTTATLRNELPRRVPRWRIVEAILVFAMVTISAWFVYVVKHPSPLDGFTNPLVILPLIAWAAIRFESPGAAFAIFVINTFCVWGTVIGSGPLAGIASTSTVNLILQARVGVTSLVALALGTAVGAARRSAAVHRRMALEIQAAGDAERTRLSHELHDDVAQKLAALKMQLQMAQMSNECGATTASSVAIVDDLLTGVRSMSYALRPAPFDQGQLAPALTALARSEGSRGGLCVLVEAPGAELPLPRDVELVCYRVVREAVTNAVKHAHARHVAVSVTRRTGALTLSIVDDGRGFDVGPTTRQAVLNGHLGLVGMRERLGRIGGSLTVSSTRGAGTTVECHLPLGEAA